MKKLFVIAALFASMAAASAQQLGVKGGLTLSTMNGAAAPKENKAMVLYEAGLLYKADLGAGFAIQPALAYQVKGATLKQANDVKSKTGFVELSLGAQWGPDLLAFRPYVFVEPYVGYGVTGNETLTTVGVDGASVSDTKINQALQDKAKNKLEYGVGVGAGIELIKHVQVSARYFWNLGNVDKAAIANVTDAISNKAANGIIASVALLF